MDVAIQGKKDSLPLAEVTVNLDAGLLKSYSELNEVFFSDILRWADSCGAQ